MEKLSVIYKHIAELDGDTRSFMYALFERYYAAVSVAVFERDLRSKSVAILLKDDAGNLQGFSTVQVIEFETANGPTMALYSGDTIISHHYWGNQQLAHAWCFFAGQIKQQRAYLPLYWFLIVKGHRTYRYLPAFSRQYYPNYQEATPPEIQAIMDTLATERFGDAYLSNLGVLHFPESRGHLRREWGEPSDDVAKKPTVAFFLEKNPGYASGDELVCITELSETNMRFVSRVAFLEGMESCRDGLIFDLASPDNARR
ncbi:MAG: hypothetical protein M3Q51_01395 [Pseudomonadota bacterium]|nr:hypothetical protein [Pseudomonadota bacterium]